MKALAAAPVFGEFKMPKCSVLDCQADATLEARLYDKYPDGTTFDEQDITCPFLCDQHRAENEERAVGARQPRGVTEYPFTNQHQAQGYTTYRALSAEAKL